MKVAMLIAGLLLLLSSMFEAWASLDATPFSERRKNYVSNARFSAAGGVLLLIAQAVRC